MPKISTRDYRAIAARISAGEAFETHGALSGGPVSVNGFVHAGIMPNNERDRLYDDERIHGIDYVIKSYATPITYRRKDGGWVEPAARYSVTTSRHQTVARCAVAIATGTWGK